MRSVSIHSSLFFMDESVAVVIFLCVLHFHVRLCFTETVLRQNQADKVEGGHDTNDYTCEVLGCEEQKSFMSKSLAVVPYQSDTIPLFYKPEREFTFAGHKITVKQNWHNHGTSGVVWDAAELLCEYLERNPHLVDGKTLIELGAGSGIVGITAACLGGKVSVTDREKAVEYLDSVVKENIDQVKYSIGVEVLDWEMDLANFTQKYDVILGADIIYIEDTFKDLLKTFLHLSDKNTLILLSGKTRYERDDKFLDMMKELFLLKKVVIDKNRNLFIYKAWKR